MDCCRTNNQKGMSNESNQPDGRNTGGTSGLNPYQVFMAVIIILVLLGGLLLMLLRSRF